MQELRMNRSIYCLLFGLAACGGATRPPGETHVALSSSVCPTQKIHFTQEAGCVNDGSVEFCLPSGDDAVITRVRAIAPTVRAISSPGRAQCHIPAETLYQFPTGAAECVNHHGALKDAAWGQVCQIAQLPQVRAIVPTWYE